MGVGVRVAGLGVIVVTPAGAGWFHELKRFADGVNDVVLSPGWETIEAADDGVGDFDG